MENFVLDIKPNLKLKELRERRKLNQTEFAKPYNVTQKTYSNYENGSTEPPLAFLIQVANQEMVSVDYLLGRSINQEFGLLTPEQKETIKMFLSLDATKQTKVAGYIAGLESLK